MSKVDPCVILEEGQMWMNGLYSFSGSMAGRKKWKDLTRTVDNGEY